MNGENELSKNRGIQLIDYLSNLNQLRRKIDRDVAAYESVLWFHDIPKNPKYCFTQAWGPTDDFDHDIWLEVKKYNEPKLESPPEACGNWVNQIALHNIEDIPTLLSSIVVEEQIPNPDWTSDDPTQEEFITTAKTLSIEDFPEVSEQWDHYVDTKWLPWEELTRKWRKVQGVYSRLFSIHQQQQKLGEEYELIVGLGLLTWKPSTGGSVRRHLITGKADIIFDSKAGKFTVSANATGSQLSIELDMLELVDQPHGAKSTAEATLESTDQNPWDRSTIDPILIALTNTLSEKGNGEYIATILEPSNSKPLEKPIVEYAPALILRKRSLRGLDLILEGIKKEILKGGEIPTGFLDISEGKVFTNSSSNVESESETEAESKPRKSQSVYFPKLYNEEQKEIVTRLESKSNVLVQGPPGTGKSHTIANLICHYLATGRRILITAQTPRALKVLNGKLPKQLRPLCIGLLGNGVEETESLKASVNTILNNQYKWNENNADRKIKELESNIHQLRSRIEEHRYKLKSVREKETKIHNLFSGAYNGSAAKIAIQVTKQSKDFEWFQDEIPFEKELPISFNELLLIRSKLVSIPEDLRKELGQAIPEQGKNLPTPTNFKDMIAEYRELGNLASNDKGKSFEKLGEIFYQSDIESIQSVIESFSKLIAEVESIRKRPMKWIPNAIYDMLTDNDTPWKEMLSISTRNLKNLQARASEISGQSINIPEDYEIKKVLADATMLKMHLQGGGKIGWGIFKDKIVKERKYLIEQVKINGMTCNKETSLELLEKHLDVLDRINNAWMVWEGKVKRIEGPPFVQAAFLEESQEALTRVVGIYTYLENAKEKCRQIDGLPEPAWSDENEMGTYLHASRVIVAKEKLKEKKDELKEWMIRIQKFSNQPNAHPICSEILPVFKSGNSDSYSKLILKIEELIIHSDNAVRSSGDLEILQKNAPILAKQIYSNPSDPGWDEQLRNINDAWNWSRATSWLRDFIGSVDIESIERSMGQIDQEIHEATAELAATYSWKFCFSRMDESIRRSLVGWQDNMKSIGKGTGKHAPKYRREAQRHLNRAKDAIPAWVMPLHRVWDTVKPESGAFDLIIVDEASQCGWQSIPLFFLAKRMIIVGDDQQISPQVVGINKDSVRSLMQEHLGDFEHADSFDAENSLFGHARRRFSAPIVLREHFRCMPEIIRFSNDLCYRDTPLIPLRQYPEDRLEPLIATHVMNGYREHSGEKIINRNEAEAIVSAIIKCCKDEKYKGKTMGVITLQGKAQASLIESMLLEKIDSEGIDADDLFKERRLVCGDSYSFQGDERHVIFLSMVVAPNEMISALTKADHQKRFNVAASRAQDQMWLFYTPTLDELSAACFRRKLLEHFLSPRSNIDRALGEDAEKLRELAHTANRQIEDPPKPFDSWFELDVALIIAARGYRVIPQFPAVEGKRIDLVIEGKRSKLAVECDGDYWHSGPDKYDEDMERQRRLERAGWTFHRIRESKFYFLQEETLNDLWKILDLHGIHPIGVTINNDQVSKENDKNQNLQVEQEESPTDMPDFSILTSDIKGPNKSGTQLTIPELDPTANLKNIKDALGMKPQELDQAIVRAIEQRPNESCKKDDVIKFILEDLKIITRGKPREEFAKKISRRIKSLEDKSVLEVYKSKNVRVRLLR